MVRITHDLWPMGYLWRNLWVTQTQPVWVWVFTGRVWVGPSYPWVYPWHWLDRMEADFSSWILKPLVLSCYIHAKFLSRIPLLPFLGSPGSSMPKSPAWFSIYHFRVSGLPVFQPTFSEFLIYWISNLPPTFLLPWFSTLLDFHSAGFRISSLLFWSLSFLSFLSTPSLTD